MSGFGRLLRQAQAGKTAAGAIIQTLSANILIQAVNILTGVVTARILAPQGRGELAAIVMWPGFLAALLTFGMQTSLIYQMRNGTQRIDTFAGTALALGLLSGILAAVTGIIGIPYWLHGYPHQVVRYAQWAMLTAPLTSLGGLLYTCAQAVQEFGRFNKFRSLPSLLILCTLLALASIHMLTPQSGAFAYLLASVPIVLWNGVWAIRRFRLRFDDMRGTARQLLGYGIRAWGMDLIGAIGDQVDRVLVVGFLAPGDLGLYIVAQSSARLFSIVPSALALVMSPKIVLLGPVLGAPLLVRTARITFMAMSLAAIPLGVLAPYAIRFVYGTKFLAAAPVFRVLLAEAVLGGFTWLLAQGFSQLGKPGRATIQQMIGLSASIPLLLLLVPVFGIGGACYALLASTALRSAFAIASYKILFGESLAHFIPKFSDLHWIALQLRASGPAVGTQRREA